MTIRRKSHQRDLILAELRAVNSHPTAMDLYEMVRRQLPRISLGTVYRNLDLLARHGLIQKLESGGSQARFDGNPDRHFHVRCVCCGQVADLPDAPQDPWRGKIGSLSGHEILGLRVEYVGICSACAEQVGPERRAQLTREWGR
jgi:Fur family ferric uptake transcriptional regulator